MALSLAALLYFIGLALHKHVEHLISVCHSIPIGSPVTNLESQLQEKAFFADIESREGYLYKKGIWFAPEVAVSNPIIGEFGCSVTHDGKVVTGYGHEQLSSFGIGEFVVGFGD